MSNIISKLEIDVLQINELNEAYSLSISNHLNSIIIHPSLSEHAISLRARYKSNIKIIIPIDWQSGSHFASLKLRDLPTDSFECDGFEILLTGDRTPGETTGEATFITEFLKTQLGEHIQVRFIVGSISRSDENMLNICRGLVAPGVRTPTLLRNDIYTNKVQVSKANNQVHSKFISDVKQVIGVPI